MRTFPNRKTYKTNKSGYAQETSKLNHIIKDFIDFPQRNRNLKKGEMPKKKRLTLLLAFTTNAEVLTFSSLDRIKNV